MNTPDRDDANPSDDAVLRRRAQMSRLAEVGQRIGWLCVGIAVVAFVFGFVQGFGSWGPVVVWALALSTLTLAPAIVLGYAVKAAEREDRDAGRGLGSKQPNHSSKEGEPPA